LLFPLAKLLTVMNENDDPIPGCAYSHIGELGGRFNQGLSEFLRIWLCA